MNISDHAEELRTLFIGDIGSIEPLRMNFGRQPSVRSIAEESSLREALSLMRRSSFSQIVIELVTQCRPPQTTANWILRIRSLFPEVVFALYGDKAELDKSIDSLPSLQRTHLRRFIRVARQYTDQDVVRLAVDLSRASSEKVRTTRPTPRYRYDAAISYAGEDRDLAESIYRALKQREVEVFYDDSVRSRTWGAHLPKLLKDVYGSQSRFCIVLASSAYKSKPYTLLELKAALACACRRPEDDYILPVRVNCEDLPGMSRQVTYISSDLGITRIVEEFERRIGEFLADDQFDA